MFKNLAAAQETAAKTSSKPIAKFEDVIMEEERKTTQ